MTSIKPTLCGVLLVLLMVPSLTAQELHPTPDTDCPPAVDVAKAMNFLRAEQLEDAIPLLVPKQATCVDNLRYLYALGHLRLLEGKYGVSRMHFEQALALAEDESMKSMVHHWFELASETETLTSSFDRYDDPDNLFSVLYPPGKDAVLVPYIKEAFPKIRQRIGDVFGYHPDFPVRIEIYGSPEEMARASNLTAEEIQTSGTIALCKHRKLMLTSPKALLQGYGWLDTLSHEYVHYVIQRLTGDRVPIWIHEGLAKYLETRWRSEKSLAMRPSSQHRLRRALKDKELIPFEDMSPSMAKLPSQDHTLLAFAEVYTVAQYLDAGHGTAGIRKLLRLMNDGKTDKEAMSEVLGMSFRSFEKKWKRFLRKQKWRSVPAGTLDLLVFKDRNNPDTERKRIGQKAAEDFTYLGDLLHGRDKPHAAAIEYKKASKRTKGVNPAIQSKLAKALLDSGDAATAYDEVQGPLPYYPEDFSLQLNLGRAAVRLGKYQQAFEALTLALRRNPFDVEVHGLMKKTADKLGKKEIVEREQEAMRLLRINR
ncbi:MAG: hypothetical protein CMH54_07045 [Myxococcales bacterium]|nr:hypothetical protein [Myxococcales bacterium]